MSSDPIVIVGAARTPMGGFQGSLKDMLAPQLGTIVKQACVKKVGAHASRFGFELAKAQHTALHRKFDKLQG